MTFQDQRNLQSYMARISSAVCLLLLLIFASETKAQQTGQTLVFPNQRLHLKTKIKLGSGWEDFRVLYPNGASFVIPTRVMVEKTGGTSYTGTGGIEFFVEGNGVVSYIDTYYDEGTGYLDVSPVGDRFIFGAGVFPGYYQINVSGELLGQNGPAGKAHAEGESAQIIQLPGLIPARNYQGGWTITVDFEDCSPCSSGDCEPGSTQAGLGSIDLSIGLGRSVLGGSVASIKAQYPNKGLGKPNFLNLKLSSDAELISSSNYPRQVRLPSGLVDIVVLDAYSYELLFYSPENVGAKDSSGFYQATGSHFRKVRIANPDASSTVFNRLHVTEFKCSGSKTTEYSYDAANNAWSLIRPDALGSETISTVETSTANGNPLSRTSIRSISNGDSTLVAKTQTKTQRFAWGWEVTEEKLDPDGAALTTSYEYYTDPALVGSYGRLYQVVDAYGNWEKYEYDEGGFETKRVTQYLDNDLTSSEASNQVVTTTYASTAPHKTVIKKINGNEVARSYTVFGSEGIGDAIAVESEITCVAPGASWNAPENLVTVTKRYNPITGGLFAGEVLSVYRPDGTLTVTSYSQTSTQRTVTTHEGEADAAGSAVIDGQRIQLVTDLQGNQISRSVSDIATEIIIETATTQTTDSHGRPTLIAYSDTSSEATLYTCCAVASRTDRNGVTTGFSYDALRRLETETRDGLTLTTIYDGAGRVKSRTRKGTDNSEITIETHEYDLAGRLISTKDGSNHTTGFSEVIDSNGRNVRTTTLPTTHSFSEAFHKDGSLLTRNGSAAHPITYEYGFATGGLRFTKEIRIGEDASETEWTKTYSDMADRIVRIEYPDEAEESRHYNTKGQLERHTDPDQVKTFFLYNGEGELQEQIVDADGNGEISSDDRRTKTVREVLAGPLVKTTTLEGPNLTETGFIQESPNGRYRREVREGIETVITRVYDGLGGSTQTTTHPDDSTTIHIFEDERIVSSIREGSDAKISESITSQYDPHRRLWKQIDERLSTVTEFGYNGADRRTSIKRGTELTSYVLDGLGQVTTETLPGTNRTISRTFYPTGELHTESGSATYPVTYTYDPQGRMRTMTTATGATTWAYHPQRGWLDSKTDDANKKVEYFYTLAARLEVREWARGVTTTYSYNDAGDLETVTYSDGTPSVIRKYDEFGRLQFVDDAAGKRELSYASRFELGTETMIGTSPWAGLTLSRGYDPLRRLNSITATRNGTTLIQTGFGYDSVSRLETATSGNNSATFAYHPKSTLVQSVTFKHSGTTAVTQSRDFDGLARPTLFSTTPTVGPSSSFEGPYNAEGFREAATVEGGSYWDYGYNDRGEVTSAVKRKSAGDPIGGRQFGYTFDGIGNRLSSTANGSTSVYTPDNLNRYASRTVPGVAILLGKADADATVTVNTQAVTRDDLDYFAQISVSNGTSPVFLNTTVEATSPSGSASLSGHIFVAQSPEVFGHDDDGNLLADGRWTYTWDGENRLASMETSTAAVQAGVPRERLRFVYDFLGRRMAKHNERWNGTQFTLHHTMHYLYDGWNLIAEMLAGGPLIRTYTWGTDMSGTWQGAGGIGGLLFIGQMPESKTFAAGYDLNGNIAGLYDLANSGEQVARYEYGPFGEPLVVSGTFAKVNPFRWSTKYHDPESGLAYFGYRYYDPETGRWLSQDPVGERGGINLYRMVENDGLNKIDPLGLLGIPASKTPRRNGRDDFVNHYYNGKGQPFDLIARGYERILEAKVSKDADSIIKPKLLEIIRKESLKTGNHYKGFELNIERKAGVARVVSHPDFTAEIFSLGNSTLITNLDGKLTVGCKKYLHEGRPYKFEGKRFQSIDDEFTDPWDLDESTGGWWPGSGDLPLAKKYKIIGTWERPYDAEGMQY